MLLPDCHDSTSHVQVPSLLDRSEDLPQDVLLGSSNIMLTVQLYLRCTGPTPLTDVTLSLTPPAGIQLHQVISTTLFRFSIEFVIRKGEDAQEKLATVMHENVRKIHKRELMYSAAQVHLFAHDEHYSLDEI